MISTKETADSATQSPPAYGSAEVGGLVSTGNKDFDDIVSKCHALLWECIWEKRLEKCFTHEEVMEKARMGPELVRLIMAEWPRYPRAFAINLIVITIADWALFASVHLKAFLNAQTADGDS